MENSFNEQRKKSAGEVEEIIKDALYNDDDEYAYEEINLFLNNEESSGSPDEFHNLSVNFSKRDDYSTACAILIKGLNRYPYSTDLLADFLQIGLFCNKEVECQKYFDVLFSIPKVKWTWRGFSFSIDYLQLITEGLLDEKEISANKAAMLSIADEYAIFFPYDEDTYLARSEIYRYFNDKDKEIECLQAAVCKGIRSPKCNLRLADFYFAQGNYEKALTYIERNKVEGIDVQDRINVGYMYYLSGLCQTAQLQLQKDFSNRKLIKNIYQDFYIAEETSDNITAFAKNIERQIFVLETKTGIKYEDAINASFTLDYSVEESSDEDSEAPTVKNRKVRFPKLNFSIKKRGN